MLSDIIRKVVLAPVVREKMGGSSSIEKVIGVAHTGWVFIVLFLIILFYKFILCLFYPPPSPFLPLPIPYKETHYHLV